jgi:hypothetical protein
MKACPLSRDKMLGPYEINPPSCTKLWHFVYRRQPSLRWRELRHTERDDYLIDLEGMLGNRPAPGRFREDKRQHLTVQCPCAGASRGEAE